ncbi:TIGR02530 family flagellar biosynthesis protein [Lederbergia graminis]|uniref:TIGR02530 family flagellar biosynthesis protein n=1 Tax=Lederbergia graminis TaxID=735518 RepID=A0ABW0LG41_9BACI|nr:TIGR02530 family flagellar biosynthesis protein [Paenibacillus bovis]HLU21899.1 TIGR02530 family flagellar biosynthesis protein [Bacillaceae bacterium]
MGNHIIHKLPSQPTTIHPFSKKVSKQHTSQNVSFSQYLETAQKHHSSLTISKHAGKRMIERDITIKPEIWNEIGEKVVEAKRKGVNDSLVLLENAALIVSAKNNTVITVMDRQEAENQIFTNIDGTIVMN